ncbi:Uma2 family endonuclease [Nocardia colli]|uniref:Uma2 family endonuclease n=1 Tax=Nocardia colli TaxID=2545717 RepID=A0A5N0EDH5_9NOCA|nr:Uma2 family endonuclease [Nocardia colli]
MTAVHEDTFLTEEFEVIERAAARELEGVQLELIDGRMGVKRMPDGDHSEILSWLLMLLMPLNPKLFLYVTGQGLAVGQYRKGRARPDGILAPRGAFRGAGEWASADEVVMAVEVTSRDSDTNRRDRVEKPVAYAQAGIPIYLLIDRDNGQVVLYTQPDGDGYTDVHGYAIGRAVTLPAPIGITIDTEELKDFAD